MKDMPKMHLILCHTKKEVLIAILDLLKQSGKVLYGMANEQIEKDSLVIEDAPFVGGYFSLKAICTDNMYEWLNGFCTSYLYWVENK